jgi:tetratricopeptide (TPR) repeat protein
VLTEYFYEQLAAFEKTPDSLRNAYPDFLHNLDLGKERKRALAITFRAQAAPELVRASKSKPADPLETAEERLAQGDLSGARDLANQALRDPGQDQPRALFILARAATLSRDMKGAQEYFERTLQVASEPRMVAWSHIYLGRILDLQEDRDEAVKHYRAALDAGDAQPDTKAAAERGLQKPYEPPAVARPGGDAKPETGETNK